MLNVCQRVVLVSCMLLGILLMCQNQIIIMSWIPDRYYSGNRDDLDIIAEHVGIQPCGHHTLLINLTTGGIIKQFCALTVYFMCSVCALTGVCYLSVCTVRQP